MILQSLLKLLRKSWRLQILSAH